MKAVLAVDAGGTYYKAALVDTHGKIISGSFKEFPSYSECSQNEILSAFRAMLKEIIGFAKDNNFPIIKTALDFPGPFDYERGACMMKHKFVSIYDVPLKPVVEELLGNPAIPVVFHNDMNAYMYGAYLYDRGKGFSRVFCIAIGTGLGGAFIQEGRIVMRPDRGSCFPIYKTPYKNGILEDIVSGRGIVNEYFRRGNRKGLDAKQIEALALDTFDELAREVYSGMGEALGESLKPLFEELAVDCVLLGGQISKAYHLFGSSLEKSLKDIRTIKYIGPLNDFNCVAIRGAAAL
jgi:glucokinase